MGKEKIILLVIAMLVLITPVYATYLDYSIEPQCTDCNEGESTVFKVTAKYDVPRLYNEQVMTYGNSTELQQTYISTITIKKVTIYDEMNNAVIAETDADLSYGATHTGIDSYPKSVDLIGILPKPKGGFVYYLPCFELHHELEVKEYDFIDGGYDSEYYEEVGDLCSKEPKKLYVRPIDLCRDCSFLESCTEEGCKFNYWYILGVILVIIAILALIFLKPRKKQPIF